MALPKISDRFSGAIQKTSLEQKIEEQQAEINRLINTSKKRVELLFFMWVIYHEYIIFDVPDFCKKIISNGYDLSWQLGNDAPVTLLT